MGLRLNRAVDIGNPSLDYHDLALLSWISRYRSVAPLTLDSPEGSGFYRSRLRRLLEAGILEEDGIQSIEEGRAKWPSFIVGCYRSGTTLLRYILDAHPRLACPPESKFIAGLQGALDYPEARAGLGHLGVAGEDVLYDLRRLIEMVLGGYAVNQGKLRWVEKTPNYFRHLDFIDSLFGGEVSYLVLIRHPLDCVDSLTAFFDYEGLNYADPEVARKVAVHGKGRYGWARFWVEVYTLLETFLTALPERTHLIRYEDLVTDPDCTVRRLLAFLGEECPPSLLSNAFSAPHTIGAQDNKITRTSSIHADSVGKWRRWTKPEVKAVWDIVGATAARFGYQAPAT